MDLKQLKYFMTVSELGSFSKAAVALSIAQPVLSRHIKSLEQEYGMEFLYRNGRGVILSEAGQVFFQHARSVVEAVRAMSSAIETIRSDPSGQLTIGIPPTASSVLTVPLIQRFRKEYPKVKLKVQIGYSGYVLEWLSAGRIDVAVLYDAPRTSTLMTQPLIEEELLLVGPKDMAKKLRCTSISAKMLGILPMILPAHPHGMRILVESHLSSIKVVPNVVLEIDNLVACLELVEQGVGYTILPYAAVSGKVMAGEVMAMPIVDPRMTRQLVLATSTQRPTTQVTRALARTVAELVRDLVHDGIWMPKIDPAKSVDGTPPAAVDNLKRNIH